MNPSVAPDCRLPVVLIGSPTSSGGFLDPHTSTYAADPAAGALTMPKAYFDRAASLWIDYPRTNLRPDGWAYAFVRGDHDVYVASAPGFSEHRVASMDQQLKLLSYENDGIYLASGHVLVRMNPDTGETIAVDRGAGQGIYLLFDNGIAWVDWVGPKTTPNVYVSLILRIDTRSGDTKEWSADAFLIATNGAGEPLVTDGSDLYVYSGPYTRVDYGSFTYNGGAIQIYNAVAIPDGDRTWIGLGSATLYLLDAKGLHAVWTNAAGTPVIPAGTCR